MFLWSDLKHHEVDDEGNYKTKVLKAGTEVSQSSLGMDDEEWAQLVEARVVRTSAYPNIPASFTGSPKDFVLQKRKQELDDIEDRFGTDEILATSDAQTLGPEVDYLDRGSNPEESSVVVSADEDTSPVEPTGGEGE